MDGDSLRQHFRDTLSADAIRELADKYGVQERERKLDVFEFVVALILAGGTHEGGRQYDVLRTYLENGAPKVRRGTFYGWFTEPLLRLLTELLERAVAAGQRQPKLLPGILGGVRDCSGTGASWTRRQFGWTTFLLATSRVPETMRP
jgi:hypothetical protein